MSAGTDVGTQPGWVIARPDLTILDTRQMEWERHPYVSDTVMKALSVDDDGDSFVTVLNYPEADPRAAAQRQKIFHATAREFIYVTSGRMFPHWEYEPDQLVTFEEGFYLDREPRTPHGSDAAASPVRVEVLAWHIDRGDFVSQQRARVETVELSEKAPADTGTHQIEASSSSGLGSGPHVIVDRPGVRVLDTRALQWQPSPEAPGARQRVLSRDADGLPTVLEVWYPPGRLCGRTTPWRGFHQFREFRFVLDGEWRQQQWGRVDDSPAEVTLKRGYYVDRRPGTAYGFDPETCSEVGCRMLLWRSDSDVSFVGEQAFGADTKQADGDRGGPGR